MAAPVRERPVGVARAGRVDPRLLRALGWSLAAHVGVVFVAILWSLFGPAPTMFEAPPGGPVVDLVTPRGDSRVFKVGPLAKAGGVRGGAAPKEVPKPTPPKPEPPKVEPKPEPPRPEPAKVVPKPEPPKPEPPKVEPKPAAIPEPKKPEPKPEPKKPEPKPEPKKPEPKPEPKKPEPKPEPKKPEPKPEPKKPEPKPDPTPEAPKADAPKIAPVAPAPTEPTPAIGTPDAGSSRPGVASTGGGTATDGGPSGDPNGGGGGQGNRSPEFYAYFGYMYRTIKEQWVWAGEQDASLAATIRFSILPDGSIAEARITERSRTPLYDESALKAVRATGRLMPPPVSVRADFADIELVFQAGDLMEP